MSIKAEERLLTFCQTSTEMNKLRKEMNDLRKEMKNWWKEMNWRTEEQEENDEPTLSNLSDRTWKLLRESVFTNLIGPRCQDLKS